MNVVVMGKGRLAIRIANWFYHSGHNLVGVVPVFPEPTWDSSLADYCKNNYSMTWKGEVNIYQKHTDVPVGQDLVFSCFYDKILRKSFLEQHKRVLNLHNSPLPRYRGVNPINWALKNGEKEHGVTIHEIDPGIDTGNIIGQVKYSIYPEFEEVKDVYGRALEYGWTLFENTIPLIDKIVPMKQNEENACYYSDKDRPKLQERSSWVRDLVTEVEKQ